MKKTLFIIIGGASLFLVFSLWVYLFLFGTPDSVTEVVGEFNFANTPVTPISPPDSLEVGESRQIDLNTGTLYQLTTRPVAGYGFISSTSSTFIMYAERGTGHIYQVDVAGGEETRLAQKTFVAISRAFFSPDGGAVVLMGESDQGTVAFLEEIDSIDTSHSFPENAKNIAFLSNRKVGYTISNQNGTAGYSYNLDTTEVKQVFGSPVRDLNVIWNEGETLIYSRTAPAFTGSLYRVSGNTLSKAGLSGKSYSAFINPRVAGLYVETYAHPESGNLVSHISGLTTASGDSLGVTALPEKCIFDSNTVTTLWCASPLGLITPKAQSDWYKGRVGFSDYLWKIDLEDGTASESDNLAHTSGREIDVIDITTDRDGDYLMFKNRNDDTLWLKRILTNPPQLNATTDEEFLSDSEEVTNSEI